MDEMAISKFKATCLAAIDRVHKTGRPLLVTKHGRPVAVIEPPPLESKPGSGFGCMAGTVEFVGDIECPLPDEWWLPDLERDWVKGG